MSVQAQSPRVDCLPVHLDGDALSGLYHAPEQEPVLDYLRKHPEVIRELNDAAPEIKRLLGSETSVRLRLSHDPNEETTLLFADILTHESAEQAWAKVRALDEWCLDHLALSFKVVFDVEFA